jgi:hypothetical protein
MSEKKSELKDRMNSEGFGRVNESIKTEKPIFEVGYVESEEKEDEYLENE